MGYLICSKCKGYYKLHPGESPRDYTGNCGCGGKIRYVENLDIVDPQWKQITIAKKKPPSEKIKSAFSLPNWNIKNRIRQYNQNLKNRINRTRNQRTIHRNEQGMNFGDINSLLNELNFNNIRWIIVFPTVIIITIILAFLPGIYTLFTLLILVGLGFLFDNQIIGVKNALICGAIGFFLGSLLSGSYLLIIPFAILGAVNGAVCGWIGGYLKMRYT